MAGCVHPRMKGSYQNVPCGKPLLKKDPRGLYCANHSPRYDEHGVYHPSTRPRSVVAPMSAAPVLQRTAVHRPVTTHRVTIAEPPVKSESEDEFMQAWRNARAAASSATSSTAPRSPIATAYDARADIEDLRRDKHALSETTNRMLAMHDARMTEIAAQLREKVDKLARDHATLSSYVTDLNDRDNARARDIAELRLIVAEQQATIAELSKKSAARRHA